MWTVYDAYLVTWLSRLPVDSKQYRKWLYFHLLQTENNIMQVKVPTKVDVLSVIHLSPIILYISQRNVPSGNWLSSNWLVSEQQWCAEQIFHFGSLSVWFLKINSDSVGNVFGSVWFEKSGSVQILITLGWCEFDVTDVTHNNNNK